MTENIPLHDDIERVIWLTVDCLRWDYRESYMDLYPEGVWYRGVPQATYTPTSHASAFTGMNPPRHGALDFYDTARQQSIFDAVNSVSFSEVTSRWHVVDQTNVTERPSHLPFEHLVGEDQNDGNTWQFNLREMDGDDYDAIADHDLSFLHDWIVHGTGPAHSEVSWTRSLDVTGAVEKNADRYQSHVETSRDAHRDFLAELQERGLYEDSLFVLWGDHGQAFNEPLFDMAGHGHFPEDNVARVPIAFCSPLFEETVEDTATTARSVDILPTLRRVCTHAGIPWADLDHETEGVDLTTFNGQLAGYCISLYTRETGGRDGVKTADFSYLPFGEELIVESLAPSRTGPSQREVDNPLMKQKLQPLYDEARTESSRLIVRHEPEDKQFLRDMGYI